MSEENTTTPAPLDFKEIFDRFYYDNPKTWDFDRDKSVGASSAFSCIRKSHFDKNPAYEQDASYKESWGAFARGNLIEDEYIVKAMYHAEDHEISQGFLMNAGPDQRTLVKDVLSATPDGLIAGLVSNALQNYGIEDIGSDCIVMEMKSIDPRVDLTEPKEVHVGQTHVQMGLIRETTDFKPNYAVLVYVDCSFFDNVKVFVVKFDPKQYKLAKRRSEKIMDFDIDPAELTPEGKINGQCDLCNYRDACATVVKAGIPGKDDKEAGNDLPPEDAKTAAILIDAERAAKKAFDDAEKTHKKLKTDLSEFIKGKGRRLVRNENFSVSIGWRDGNVVFDKSALEDDLEELKAKLEELGHPELALDMEDYKSRGQGYEVVTVRNR